MSFLHSPSEDEEFSRLFCTFSPTEYVTNLINAINRVRRSDDLAAADIIVKDKGEGLERVLRSLIPPTSLLEVGSGPFVVFITYAQHVKSTVGQFLHKKLTNSKTFAKILGFTGRITMHFQGWWSEA